MVQTQFTTEASRAPRPKILLALQGGGSHGAFTAGAIQALEEAGILVDVVGVSGTSAGASNAACVSYALNSGKPEFATRLTHKFWERIAQEGDRWPMPMAVNFARASTGTRAPNLPDVSEAHLESMTRMMGVSQPGYIRDLINHVIPDWNVIRKGSVKTVIGAARVVSSKFFGAMELAEHNFHNAQIDADAIAASSTIVGTHMKGGMIFVDGAYLKNPPIRGIMPQDEYTDVVAIMLNPLPSHVTPSLQENFQTRSTKFVGQQVYGELAHIYQEGLHHTHVIAMEHEPHWNETSKRNFERSWIENLKASGYRAARQWIENNSQSLGLESSFRPVIIPPEPEFGLRKELVAA
jgi:NTE family protein